MWWGRWPGGEVATGGGGAPRGYGAKDGRRRGGRGGRQAGLAAYTEDLQAKRVGKGRGIVIWGP